jgi:DNA-binding MarR family transcriptional regulator
MTDGPGEFDLGNFLPYLLNQAAEATSRSFQEAYRSEYGMSRTQWRVLANLGKFGAMTAAVICRISHLEKTKVSRAVQALEAEGLLTRETDPADRRAEHLRLTAKGQQVVAALGGRGLVYDRALRAALGEAEAAALDRALRRLIEMGGADEAG